MNEPRVSVILPCYNQGKYTEDAILSVLGQTYTNIEFIVANNGSTDCTGEVLAKYKDKFAKLIELSENNIKDCLTLLQDSCSGKYIAMMHADDVWEPTKIEKQVNILENKDEYVACFTWASYVDENLNLCPGTAEYFCVRNRTRKEWYRRLIYYGNVFSYPSILINREIMLKIRNRQFSFMILGDYNNWLEALRYGNIYVIDEKLVKMRRHGKNMSRESQEIILRSALEETMIFSRILDEFTDEEIVDIFQEDFVNPNAIAGTELLCEKTLLAKKLAEKKMYHLTTFVQYYQKCLKDRSAMAMLEGPLYRLDHNEYNSFVSERNRFVRYVKKDNLSLQTIQESLKSLDVMENKIHLLQHIKLVINYGKEIEKRTALMQDVNLSTENRAVVQECVAEYIKVCLDLDIELANWGITQDTTDWEYVVNKLENIESADDKDEIVTLLEIYIGFLERCLMSII